MSASVEDVSVGEPTTFAILERFDLVNVASRITLAPLEQADDFVVRSAIRTQDTHAKNLMHAEESWG
jgi:hypothetical protein